MRDNDDNDVDFNNDDNDDDYDNNDDELFMRSCLPVATAGSFMLAKPDERPGEARRGGAARASSPIRLFYGQRSRGEAADPLCS